MSRQAEGRRFGTTEWSLVLAAGEQGSAAGAAALARLCALYWYPIFAFVRRQGHTTDEAEDLTQGFFARLIEKGDLADADRNRGRFRSFLLSACQHFLANEWDKNRAQKRGGGRGAVSLEAAAVARTDRALAHGETPELLYERQWCLTLLAGVLEDLQEEYVATGRERVFERLKRFLTTDDDPGTYLEAAQDLALTEGAVKVAVHRLRNRYRDALRARVAATVASDDQVTDEIQHLLQTLGTRPQSP